MVIRFFVSLLIKLFLDLPVILLGFIIFPIAYQFRKNNHLPIWAWPWDNKTHGIDGGNFWAQRTVGWSHFKRCYWWCCFRNPTYNWSSYVIGTTGKPVTYVKGNAIDVGPNGKAGWYYVTAGKFWEFYLVKPYGSRCLRFRFGWKLQGKKIGDRCPHTFNFNPLMPYKNG